MNENSNLNMHEACKVKNKQNKYLLVYSPKTTTKYILHIT